jgi:penicillin amidase
MENILVSPVNEWTDDITTKQVSESLGDIIGSSFQQAIKEISAKHGSNPAEWKWGNEHLFTLAHPMSSVKLLDKALHLNRGPYSVGGSFHTVSPYSNPLNKNSGVNNGASERHIFDASDWDLSLTVIPTGTSGIPASKYYCDQTDMYLNNVYHTDYVTRTKVESKKLYQMKFTR